MKTKISLFLTLLTFISVFSTEMYGQSLLSQQAKISYGYWDIAQTGKYLVGSRYSAPKLDIYDVNDPQNAVLLSQTALNSAVSVVSIFQNRYALLGGYKKITIMDLNNVNAPTQVVQIPMDGDITGISCYNNIAYVSEDISTSSHKLEQIDLSVITQPAKTTSNTFGSSLSELKIEGTKAFLLEKKQSYATLYAYNINSNGSISLKSLTTLPASQYIDVKGGIVYISTSTKVLAYDNNDMSALIKLSETNATTPMGVVGIDATHFATSHSGSVKLVDVNTTTTEVFTSNAQPLNLLESNGFLYYSTVSGTYILQTTNSTTDIGESDLSTEVSVYPNPSTEAWFIKSSVAFKGVLSIWNYQGQKISECEVDFNETVRIENIYPSGMYLYTIDSEDGKYTSGWLMSQK